MLKILMKGLCNVCTTACRLSRSKSIIRLAMKGGHGVY